MFAVFGVMRELHELLWFLTEALGFGAARPLRSDLSGALAETERLTELGPEALAELDVDARRRRVGAVLRRVSELVRGHGGRQLRGADPDGCEPARRRPARGRPAGRVPDRRRSHRCRSAAGRSHRRRSARRGDAGADLGASIFLTQFQVNAAAGDGETVLPEALTRPAHWSK
jgi:hypothetical protein